MAAPWAHGQDGDFFEEEKRRPRRRLRGFTTTCNPLARVGMASRLISDVVGFVNVSEA
jgi:hypothetical protein